MKTRYWKIPAVFIIFIIMMFAAEIGSQYYESKANAWIVPTFGIDTSTIVDIKKWYDGKIFDIIRDTGQYYNKVIILGVIENTWLRIKRSDNNHIIYIPIKDIKSMIEVGNVN